MEHTCATIVCETIEHCHALMRLAERGMRECTHEDCMLLYGFMLDSAYRLKAVAESHHGEWHAVDPAFGGSGPWPGE